MPAKKRPKDLLLLAEEDLAKLVCGVRWIDSGPDSYERIEQEWARQTSAMKRAHRAEALRYLRAFVADHERRHAPTGSDPHG